MDAVENKQVMQQVFADLAKGNADSLVASLADDVRWTITGTTPLSRTFTGKRTLVEGLLGPLQVRLKAPFTVRATRILADADCVVVEFRGEGNVTTDGKPYDNAYCLVARMLDGKIVEATEYLDTELIRTALLPGR